jgi:hypothetical protein
MIDYCKTTAQINLLISSLNPYIPALLLDQFGNYVVQCLLKVGSHRNGFIFDAMNAKCSDIARSRFGARAIRACLESPYVSKSQQKLVASAIVQNAKLLVTHQNGAILITWLLGILIC